ncbi:hypothetical protein [Pandoraea pnomenusa]|uniref:hypothetical protein n=1 Tax=Pandoraea pnomenusa TaxID=93220 RepID=UPI000B23C0DD|nr:hypothetical protein [Pandoraea pnomenusa]
MKRLYAQFVLWLISPALRLEEEFEVADALDAISATSGKWRMTQDGRVEVTPRAECRAQHPIDPL